MIRHLVSDKLSIDLTILREIRLYEKMNEPVWFSKLVERFNGQYTKPEISKTLDKLFDLCFIDGSWEKVDGKWTRVFHVDTLVTNLADDLIARDVSA